MRDEVTDSGLFVIKKETLIDLVDDLFRHQKGIEKENNFLREKLSKLITGLEEIT